MTSEEKTNKPDVLKQIREVLPELSKSRRAIGQFIVSHYDKAADMTAAKLGQYVGVSESTVVRFAVDLGYEGYPELRHALHELNRTKLTSVQRLEMNSEHSGRSDILTDILNGDIEKIKNTLDTISHGGFANAVDTILRARSIYIIGMRSSAPLANFLHFHFRVMFPNVQLISNTSVGEIFEQMLHLTKEDAVIAISYPRYSKRVVTAVNYAKSQGARIISITDDFASPIAEQADSLLLAKSNMASFVDSMVAPLSVINALIAAVGKMKQVELEKVFNRLETLWDEYEEYDKTHDGQ